MAFVTIDSDLYDVGDPVKRELLQKLVDNQSNLQTRVTSVEAASGQFTLFNSVMLNADSASTLTGLAYITIPFQLSVIDFTIGLYDVNGAGFSGTVEADLKRNSSRSEIGMSSILTTKPSISTWTVDYVNSSNAVLNSLATDITALDTLRLDITSMPSGNILGKLQLFVLAEI